MLIRPVNQEWETWKWIAATLLALAMAFLFATAIGAGSLRS